MKKLFSVACVVFLVLYLTACMGNDSGGAIISLTDSAGREVTLKQTATKIIVMTPSDVEIFYALAAQDAIIAVGEYCDYPEESKLKQNVGTGENTSVEQLIALEPDLVIMGMMAQQKEQAESLDAAGIPVFVSSAQTIADTYTVIEQLGQIVGKQDAAMELIADMQADFETIALDMQGKEKSVYIEISPLESGLYTCGKGTFIDELTTYAGLKNIFGDLEGWPSLSEEQVIARNPDVILTTADGSFGPAGTPEEIVARSGWNVIAAVQAGDVKIIDPQVCTRPGPRLVDAAREMYSAAYGQ